MAIRLAISAYTRRSAKMRGSSGVWKKNSANGMVVVGVYVCYEGKEEEV